MTQSPESELQKTPLDRLHRKLGAKMVAFAGYDMPVQYLGIMAEHRHTRQAAGLFDVSHMGQAQLHGANAVRALETLVPADIKELGVGRMRYTVLTDHKGGILDDLMVTVGADHLHIVVNASRKAADFAHIASHTEGGCRIEVLSNRALLALQGPAAVEVLARFAPPVRHLAFMSAETLTVSDIPCLVSRSGYTGEDGFEISVPADAAEALAETLLAEPEVKPIGLGARDTLRLEAGLCLYGSDIDTTTTPVEAGLAWTIGKRRRTDGGFPGAARILAELATGPRRRRVGLLPEGKAPARAHTPITTSFGATVGEVTSGGFGPSLDRPIAMGYVDAAHAAPGTALQLVVRGKPLPATVTKLPFVTRRYIKK